MNFQQIGNGGILDLSSNKPHVTIECPLCHIQYMVPVIFNRFSETPCCKVRFCIKPKEKGPAVSIELYLSKEQTEQYQLLLKLKK